MVSESEKIGWLRDNDRLYDIAEFPVLISNIFLFSNVHELIRNFQSEDFSDIQVS